MPEDVPSYLMHRMDEVVSRFDRLDEKMDLKFGEYGMRIATNEAELRHAHQRINTLAAEAKETKADATSGRRWAITTLIAVVAIVVPVLVALAVKLGGM